MQTIRTWREGGAAWIEIDRPERLNALNRATLEALCGAVEAALDDESVRVLLLAGAGERAFCAGADVAEMTGQDRAGIHEFVRRGKALTLMLEQSPRPVIAVVHGYALGGGCELALACDLVLAAEGTRFGLPEVDLGVLPGWGGSQRLERRVGYGRARLMLLTGARVSAQEALTWGLCERVVPGSELRAEASRLAQTLAGKDATALAGLKRALRWGSELPLEERLDLETDLFVRLFDRPEREAAMRRFLKRE